MTDADSPRLLPWSGPGGAPCYLNTRDSDGLSDRVADSAEEDQLDRASGLLAHTEELLARDGSEPDEMHYLVRPLVNALRDVLRVAVSRGARLHITPHTATGTRSHWLLSPDCAVSAQYAGECTVCAQQCSMTSSPKRVHEWLLRHAQETDHLRFEVLTHQFFTVAAGPAHPC
ncbi:hypothetical protein ACFP1Z_25735 [Streptomyces gamaensis]|uniref:DUF7848 domain-containing protein n=1 Tax=Streptomyces gamaensis TaxID=1763542 RepID=A0ABW0Z564_9ACTN